ncbi:MAG: DUF4443 domain-containing protein [Candidatus Bathyarchaeia archaeon]
MSFKDFLIDLSAKRAPGPLPSFNVFDLIRLLRLLADKGFVGRSKISETLSLGEGVTRTMLERLAEADLITISRRGCSLTEKGKSVWKTVEEVMPKIAELEDLEPKIAPKNVAVLVRGRAERVKSGIEQRDAAISNGAKGAITAVYKDNRLIVPGVNIDLEKSYPRLFKIIMRLMEPKEGDVIIISGADILKNAEYGALAAAWSII